MLYIMEETEISGELKEFFFSRLPEEEQGILGRRRNERAFAQGLLSRLLLFYGLKKEYSFSDFPKIEREEKGKPYLPAYRELHFNYSHSECGIFLGLSREEIGVDIQGRIPFKEKLAGKILHPREEELLYEEAEKERIFTELWCLKEAYLKYTGEGIRRPLGELDFSGIVKGEERFGGLWCRSFSEKEGSYGICAEKAMEPPVKVSIKDVKAIF